MPSPTTLTSDSLKEPNATVIEDVSYAIVIKGDVNDSHSLKEPNAIVIKGDVNYDSRKEPNAVVIKELTEARYAELLKAIRKAKASGMISKQQCLLYLEALKDKRGVSYLEELLALQGIVH